MNYKLDSTVSIDTVIQSIQTDLYTSLGLIWPGELNGYGRVHKNGGKAEWYSGEGEYEGVYFDDNFSGNFFFIDEDQHSTEDEFVFKSDVKCVFMVNLNDILPNSTLRQDLKAQEDVIKILRDIAAKRYTITGVDKDLKSIFRDLDTSAITFENIHPSHSFAVNIKLSYYLSEC
jgi:hypothetical protein